MATIAAERSKTYDIVYIGTFAVLMAICSWISIPTAVPFTLQTFGLCLTGGILGGKRGTMVILVYILLGAVGVPVFAGFHSGIGVLLGTTGGYIIGCIFSMLIMWGMEQIPGKRNRILGLSMVLALIVCYGFGTAWFMVVYARTAGQAGLLTVLGWCVFPFVIPDLLKAALAFMLTKRLTKVISLSK